MTRREKLERKSEKRLDWADSRKKKAYADWEKADMSEEKTGIPMGQPILMGHHSARRHRNVIKRADAAMRRGAEHNEMSKHHASKAAGLNSILDRSIFSDDEDAADQLEMRIAKHEADRKQNNAINKIIRRKPKGEKTQEKVADLEAMGLREHTIDKLFEPDFMGRVGIPAYVNQNLGGRIRADRDRLKIVKAQAANRAAAAQSENGVVVITNANGDAVVTFSEKPEREILTALKSAGFRWFKGSWVGPKDGLPDEVKEMV